MRIGSINSPLARATVSLRDRPRDRGDVATTASATSTYELARLYRGLIGLRKELAAARSELARAFRPSSQRGLSELRSAAPLGLNDVGTAARLVSGEEINTTPTSFTPFGPAWQGPSTSLPTLGGEYQGTTDETLQVRVRRGGLVGSRASLSIEVFDEAGDRLQRVNIERSTPPNTPLPLDNGLVLSFSPGNLQQDDYFEVAVSASVGSSVRPDEPFNGVRNDNPNLDPGQTVSAGSFQVNGVTIAVAEDDSIQSVADKITASAAGVSAEFDAASERLRLTSRSLGTEGQIVLGGDTSGFLDAAKLSGGVLTPGIDPDPQRPLASVGPLGEVRDGSFEVDGHAIDVDTSQASLLSLVSTIDALPQISSSYHEGRVRLARDGGILELADGTSSFFTAIGIATGEHRFGSSEGRRLRPTQRARIADSLQRLSDTLSRLVSPHGDPVAESAAAGLRTRLLEVAVANGSNSPREPSLLERVGLRLAAPSPSEPGRAFAELDRSDLLAHLTRNFGKVEDALLRRPSGSDAGGLLEQLDEVLRSQQAELLQEIAERGGHVVDVLA